MSGATSAGPGPDTRAGTAVSALAAQRGARPVPGAARSYEVGVDAADPAALAQVWATALGYRVGPGEDEVTDPHHRGPTVWFQRTATPAASRLHLDVHIADELQDRAVAAVAAPLLYLRRRAAQRDHVEIRFDDGSSVTLAGGPDAEELLSIARRAL